MSADFCYGIFFRWIFGGLGFFEAGVGICAFCDVGSPWLSLLAPLRPELIPYILFKAELPDLDSLTTTKVED